MSDISLVETAQQHQRQAEWYFAAAVYDNNVSLDLVKWVEPDMLRDERVRRYWAEVKNGARPDKAAIDSGIFLEIAKYQTASTYSSMGLQSFAQAIADDIYLQGVATDINQVARLVMDRKLGEIAEKLQGMASRVPGGNKPGLTFADVGLEFLSTLSDTERTIDTGLPILQRNMGGLERQTLTIIAARPSMGKTALAIQFARAAADTGAKVAFFSLEMSRISLFGRMACGSAKVPYVDYRARRLTAQTEQAVKDAASELIDRYENRIIINDKTYTKTDDIWRFCAEVRPDILFVDHLSKVSDDGDNEVRRLGHISWGGKQMAKEFDLAAVYLMQLNRQVENRDNKEPKLSDLRDSGEIEQDADVVLFIHRPDYYEQPLPNQVVSKTKLVIGKDRNGARNYAMPLIYHMLEQRFYEEAK